MITRRVFYKQTLWSIALLLGVAVLTAACGAAQTPTPCPEVECPECPEATCPEPVLYEDVWGSSAHADRRAEAFTHWDEDDPREIPIDCAKCHSTPGYLDFLGVDGTEVGRVDNAAQTGTTVTCYVCHNSATADMDRVVFPSGAEITGLHAEARCIQCHQGRASTVTVNDAIAEAGLTHDDTVGEELGFVNSHYHVAGAVVFGTEVQGAYEYDGETYHGRFTRAEDFFSCIRCHNEHSLELKFETCGECHTSAKEEAQDIRVDTTDYDGDGDIEEGIVGEIETIHRALYAAIQTYASDEVEMPIVYDSHVYPYFFLDSNDNGEVDPDEAVYPNSYHAWTPRLLRAAYNYQFVSKDPGAFAHNPDYVIQVLYDSLADVGGDVTDMARP